MTRAREQCRRTRSAAPARVPRQGFFSRRTRKHRHAASARTYRKAPILHRLLQEHRKSHDSGWMVDGRDRSGRPCIPCRGPSKNASEGSVSLPEYASSVKDDRSGWKGGTPSEERKNVLCRVSVFFVPPPSGGEGGRSRSLKGARLSGLAVRTEETYSFRFVAKGASDCSGIKQKSFASDFAPDTEPIFFRDVEEMQCEGRGP